MQSFRERNNGASSLSKTCKTPTQKPRSAELLQGDLSDLENKRPATRHPICAIATAHPNDTEALLRTAERRVLIPEGAGTQPADRRFWTDEFTLLKQHYRAKHPSYIATQTQLVSLTHDRNQVLQDVIALLKTQRQQLQDSLDALKNMRDGQQTQLLSTTGKTVEYNDLERKVNTNKALFESVNSRIAQIGVASGLTETPVQVHELASSASPVRVSAFKVYGLALVMGLLAGLGLALGLHFMDRSVKTIDQAERLAGVPVLTAVPRKARKEAGAKGVSYSLDMISDRDGIVAESFRTLRTSLAMTTQVEDRRVFMFTSAVPAEGKTFCSSNFAVTLAYQGFKTLLIDADLRRPMVSRVFFGEQRKPGLVDILAGQCTLRDAALDTEAQDLKVLTAGNRAPNPAELLSSAKIVDLLKEAFQTYDRVVIDTAPVLAVSDSLLIAPHVDVTCLVLRSFKTPRKTFMRAIKSLDDINCRPVGVVFNFMPTGAGSYYYYSGKYHGDYGTKGVYGT